MIGQLAIHVGKKKNNFSSVIQYTNIDCEQINGLNVKKLRLKIFHRKSKQYLQ